jgi:hypothetical protein
MRLFGEPDEPYDSPTWEGEVRALYLRSIDMGADEFELLLDVAMRDERPEHPDLPLYLGFGMATRGECR